MMFRLFMLLGLVVSSISVAFAEESAVAWPITVMSFNVRYGTAMDGENAWPKRRDILTGCIKEYAPDLVGTQECLEFQADYIVEQLKDYRWIGIGRDRNGRGEMAAIFYRWKELTPVESGNFWLSEQPDEPGSKSWDSSLTRIVTWAKFFHPKTETHFYYFNTHFDHRGPEARKQSAHLLAERIKALPAALPVLVTGDFNAVGEESAPWRVLAEAGLKDAWVEAAERKGPVTTWSAFQAPDAESRQRIDWILFRGPVSAAYAETVTYNLEGRYPSDHYPVVARLLVRR
jgi:endonuclease/exonuclease/phosphatase family metal-dependent hydrolase